jgi:hypothetical protein
MRRALSIFTNSNTQHMNRHLAKIISLAAALCAGSAFAAQPIVTVNLSGATFGEGLDVHLSSGAQMLPPAASYNYQLSGTVKATGLLANVITDGTSLSTLLEQIQPGSSSLLSGQQLNPNGTLPFAVINRTFSGSFPVPVIGNVAATVTVKGRITAAGVVRFDVTNFDLTIPGNPDIGTVQFQSGSLVVAVSPVIEFKINSVTVKEDVGTVSLRVKRRLNTNGTSTVHFESAPFTATAADYVPVNSDLTFADGESTKTIAVTINNRPGTQGSRFFKMKLSNPSAGAILGAIVRERVTITDAP